jgi:hypothetical protein
MPRRTSPQHQLSTAFLATPLADCPPIGITTINHAILQTLSCITICPQPLADCLTIDSPNPTSVDLSTTTLLRISFLQLPKFFTVNLHRTVNRTFIAHQDNKLRSLRASDKSPDHRPHQYHHNLQEKYYH